MIYKISESVITKTTQVHIPKYKIVIAKLFNIPIEYKYHYRANVTIHNQPYMIPGQVYGCGNGIKWIVLSFDNWTASIETVEPCQYITVINPVFMLLFSAHLK
jgi:hypothetical protein